MLSCMLLNLSKDQIVKNQIRRSPSSFCQSMTMVACQRQNDNNVKIFSFAKFHSPLILSRPVKLINAESHFKEGEFKFDVRDKIHNRINNLLTI